MAACDSLQCAEHYLFTYNQKRRKTIAAPQPTAIILDSTLSEKNPAEPKQQVLGVIPARLASTRLSRKVLREIAGRPMLAWVYEAAMACPQLDAVVVATDSEEVAELCQTKGWLVQMTSAALASGSDRVHAISQIAPYVDYDVYVNIQGDEPLLRPEHLTALLRPFGSAGEVHPHVEVTTLKVACTEANISNSNAVKVVTAADGRALYFSRATIPYDRDGSKPFYWKHIGLYAYRRKALDRFATLQASTLEIAERLEQLRFLENGVSLYVEPTSYDTIGVDTERDLKIVEDILLAR